MRDSRPNILLITCHDLGRFLGCYGIETVETPNLDRLAADGVMFTNAFCTAPQCSPSRASIFTGRFPQSNGVLGLTHGEFGWDLNADEEHLAQLLGREGYRTGMVGVLHEAREIERCGFGEVHSPGHDALQAAEQVINRLRTLAEDDRPFYLQLGFHEPHRLPASTNDGQQYSGFVGDYIRSASSKGVTVPPYIADTPAAREEIAELQGAVSHLDVGVGIVLDELRRLNLDHRTLVVFTTDHGLALPRAKCSLYDPGIEVALIVRDAAVGWGGGRTIGGLVSNVDLLPTILDRADVSVPDRVQGKSLSALLDGAVSQHRDHVFAQMTYHDYYHPQRCIRTERHKLIVNFTTAPSFMDPTQSWHRRVRPVVPAEPAYAYAPLIELYDLEVDPNEWRNVAGQEAYQAEQRALLDGLLEWLRATDDPILAGAVMSPRHHSAIAALLDA